MKKGFTLIELLAVIVILAIIALIATPITLNIIEESRVSSVKISLDNLARAVDLYYGEKELNGGFSPITFICKNNKCTNTSGTETLKIEARGIERGTIDVDSDGNPTYSLIIAGHKCIGVNDEVVCEPGRESIVKSDDVDDADVVITGLRNKILNNYRIYGSSEGVGNSTDNGYVIPVTVRGKNLVNPQFIDDFIAKIINAGHGTRVAKITDESGREIFWFNSNVGYGLDNYAELRKIFSGIFKENTQYTFSAELYVNKSTIGTNLLIFYSDGNSEGMTSPSSIDANVVRNFVFTTATGKTISAIGTQFSSGSTYIYTDTLQIEEGANKTSYEPYVTKTFDITLPSPLMEGDYIDFETQKVVRSNGETISVELPIIHSLDLETTILEVNTTNKPSNIEVTYIK